MDYFNQSIKYSGIFFFFFISAVLSAAVGRNSGTNATSAAPSNLQEDAVPFGSPFQLSSSGFNNNPAFGGISPNPAVNFRLRNDFQAQQPANLPYSQPNCLGHQPGMYGSPTYDCQVFFICQADGRLDPMPCPQGTRFNNYLGVCDWPQKVDANCNPIYSENYERYGALATLYSNEPISSQYRLSDIYSTSNIYGAGVNQRFQSQAQRFPQASYRSNFRT